MPYGMYVSAEGAQMQSRRLEVLANNLANVNTPGFKRDVPTFQARLAEAVDQGIVPPESGGIEDLGGGVMNTSIVTDFSPGTIKRTGIPTDFALANQGFFEVRGDNGENLLTRAGNFTLTSTGQLTTQNGRPVLAQDGTPITITPEAPWSISTDGYVIQEGSAVPLAIVSPPSLGDLVKTGENLFRSLGEATATDERVVRQGYLEHSSVSPTLEMMALIETTRAYETNVKMIQHQDSMIEGLVSRILQS